MTIKEMVDNIREEIGEHLSNNQNWLYSEESDTVSFDNVYFYLDTKYAVALTDTLDWIILVDGKYTNAFPWYKSLRDCMDVVEELCRL